MDERHARSRRGVYTLLAILVVAGISAGAWVWHSSRTRDHAAPAPLADVPASPPAELGPAASELTEQTDPVPVAPPPPRVAPVAPPAAQVQAGNPDHRLMAEAAASRSEGKLQLAREKALAALAAASSDAIRSSAEALAGQVGIELLLTPHAMPEKIDYTVQAGDSLDKIARRHGTTVELLLKSNQLRTSVIRPGDRLRVFNGAWSIRVSKSRNDLLLLLNDQFFKRYRVGTGEYAKTPVGEFKIVDRIAQPTWWHPDGRTIPYGHPENLLGTHWLALDVKGYGLHGTWEPETVGHQASMGCVRLVNEDIEELFTILTAGTPVVIEE